jgi:hypothetical protein
LASFLEVAGPHDGEDRQHQDHDHGERKIQRHEDAEGDQAVEGVGNETVEDGHQHPLDLLGVEGVLGEKAAGLLAVEVAEAEELDLLENTSAQVEDNPGHGGPEQGGAAYAAQLVDDEQGDGEGGEEQDAALVSGGKADVEDALEDDRQGRDGEDAQDGEREARREGAAVRPDEAQEIGGQLLRLARGHARRWRRISERTFNPGLPGARMRRRLTV